MTAPGEGGGGMSAMTEDVAKTKWCPFARLSEMGGTYNRCGPAANLECIGSDCMAWRWGESEHVADAYHNDVKPKGEVNPPFSNCPEGILSGRRRRVFCRRALNSTEKIGRA